MCPSGLDCASGSVTKSPCERGHFYCHPPSNETKRCTLATATSHGYLENCCLCFPTPARCLPPNSGSAGSALPCSGTRWRMTTMVGSRRRRSHRNSLVCLAPRKSQSHTSAAGHMHCPYCSAACHKHATHNKAHVARPASKWPRPRTRTACTQAPGGPKDNTRHSKHMR